MRSDRCRRPGLTAGGRQSLGRERPAMTRRMLILAAMAGLLASLTIGGTAFAAGPDLGPNVLLFDPGMSTSEIQAAVDSVASEQVSNQFGTQRYALLFKPGTYGSSTEPAQLPGRLLHRRRRPRPVPERRRHQRIGLRPQPVQRRQLRRAQQLLALAVEPDDQRDHARLRLLQRRVLGRVAGRADAPGPRQRADDADGLLHRPVVRERRLHRRFGVRRQHRHQRLAAAVAGQEQHARWVDQRRLEPGVLGRRRSPRPVLPRATERLRPVHDAGDEPGHARVALPVPGRRRPLRGLRPGGAARHRGHDVGEWADGRHVHPHRRLLHRPALGRCARPSTMRSPGAGT